MKLLTNSRNVMMVVKGKQQKFGDGCGGGGKGKKGEG